MSMDIMGVNPSSVEGHYFRVESWRWDALWNYCCTVAPEICANVTYGKTNDGDGLDEKQTVALAGALVSSVKSGWAANYLADGSTFGKNTHQVLDVGTISGFAQFLTKSGGFEIW